MTDLDTLRPEVRSALGAMVRADVCRDSVPTDAFDIIRAELLRLAGECATLSELLDSARMDRIDEFRHANKVEAELAAAQNTINAQQDTMGALKQKLALSEGELAALKAKIEAAPLTTFRSAMVGTPHAWVEEKFACPEWIGKRVRLVVEE